MSSIQTTVVDMPDYEILKPGIKKSWPFSVCTNAT